MTLRVLVVSDVRIVQEGVRSVLAQRDEVDVVGTTNLRHAGDQSAQLHPDVVLLDAARRDSLELVTDVVAAAPHARVVAFGVKETGEEILALAAAGTAGYVRDSAKSCDLVHVLERVMCDELPCSAHAAASLYRRVALLSHAGDDSRGDCQSTPLPLSRRELQIAHLIDRGLTNKAIGRKLGIEPATVKNHVHNLCEKLKVHRRGEAAARLRALLRAHTLWPAAAPDADPAPEAS